MEKKSENSSRVAVIGGGVSGLVTAWLLHQRYDVTLFEAGDEPGGHACTTRVEHEGSFHDVDTGFVVYNEVTYPHFVKLLDRLGVETEGTGMSFSVRCDRTGLEYCGTNPNTLFAQRRNLVRPAFYRMILDIFRFNRDAVKLLDQEEQATTLGEFFREQGYGPEFVEQYIVPMAAAIWSASPEQVLEFPALFFVRFFHNHGLLGATGHLQWRVISGGSQRYVQRLVEPFRDRIRTGVPVEAVRRLPDRVDVTPAGGEPEGFDQVVLAVHSDQALKMLADPSPAEREILSELPYQMNDAVLYAGPGLLPRRPAARASWNYHVAEEDTDRVAVTYDMSRLQNLDTREPLCVSLNPPGSDDPGKVFRRMRFAHPVFTPASIRAQNRWGEISGVNRTHYCGAYWRNGFHEDGVFSALRAAQWFGCGMER